MPTLPSHRGLAVVLASTVAIASYARAAAADAPSVCVAPAAANCPGPPCDRPLELSDPEPRLRLGLAVGLDSGIAGRLANVSNVIAVGPELSLPLGPLRWHFLVAFDTVDTPGAYSGVRIEALDFGVPLKAPFMLPGRARLEIEPILLNAVEVLASAGHEILGSSVIGAQANLVMDDIYCSALPFALEVREWSFQGDGGATSGSVGSGLDYVFRGSCGVRF